VADVTPLAVQIWLDERRPVHIDEGEEGNLIHADLIGAGYWGTVPSEEDTPTHSSLGSWETFANLPGGTSVT
jgi:hypothetical protein